MLLLLGAAPAAAQTPYERVGLDATVGDRLFRRRQRLRTGRRSSSTSSARRRSGRGWQAVRPALVPAGRVRRHQRGTPRRLGRADLPGEPALRAQPDRSRRAWTLGYMPSPIGLGVVRYEPEANPIIAGHSSYFMPMLPFDTNGRALSGDRVDLSACGRPDDLDESLGRARRDRQLVAGPHFHSGRHREPARDAGLRSRRRRHAVDRDSASAPSFARGDYLTARESRRACRRAIGADDGGIRRRICVRYTKISGEVIHDTFACRPATSARRHGSSRRRRRSRRGGCRRPPRGHIVTCRRTRRAGILGSAALDGERADGRFPRQPRHPAQRQLLHAPAVRTAGLGSSRRDYVGVWQQPLVVMRIA